MKKRLFIIGDIVKYKPSFNSVPSGEGVVIKTKDLAIPAKAKKVIRQVVYVAFAESRTELELCIRRLSFGQACESMYKVHSFDNHKLKFIEECPVDWFEPLTSKEVSTCRFLDLLEEDNNGS